MQNQTLWTNIAAHPMPADSAGRPFVEQLCEDQKISRKTAERGILEYKRFLYLCATGGGRCVPTKAVDAVWHLHLTHTRDYWNRFVPQVLDGQAIHHTPGAVPGHAGDFKETLRRYAEEFGETPPKGIWQRKSLGSGLTGMFFALLFTSFWLFLAIAGDAPVWFVAAGGLMGVLVLFTTVATALDSAGISTGLEFDIWSDSDGGDCGDCGGGCGD